MSAELWRGLALLIVLFVVPATVGWLVGLAMEPPARRKRRTPR